MNNYEKENLDVFKFKQIMFLEQLNASNEHEIYTNIENIQNFHDRLTFVSEISGKSSQKKI